MSEIIILTSVVVAEIMARFDAIEAALTSQATPPDLEHPEPLVVDRPGAAKMLHSSVSSVDNWRRNGSLPYIQLGSKPMFLVADIEAFVAKHRRGGDDAS